MSKLEEGNWKDKSIALMKTMLADTLILVSTIVVLLLVCLCLCRCMYFRYYYTKHTDEEVQNLTGESTKDIELVSQFQDSPSGSTQMAWESIKDETSVWVRRVEYYVGPCGRAISWGGGGVLPFFNSVCRRSSRIRVAFLAWKTRRRLLASKAVRQSLTFVHFFFCCWGWLFSHFLLFVFWTLTFYNRKIYSTKSVL